MIHQYKSNGYNIIMDVNSGSIHVVEPVVYDTVAVIEGKGTPLSNGQTVYELEAPAPLEAGLQAAVHETLDGQYGAELVEEALAAVQTLIDAEQLFVTDSYKNFVMDFKARKTVVKALCLHIAHDCNLACKYCFAEEGEYHGRRALMSFEVGKKALDFLVANSGSRRNLEVDFFGGEPLLNWDVVKRLVEYGRTLEEPNNKRFRFTFTTNGVLLNDEIMEFCNREMSNVVMSLDGRREINDAMRPFRKGTGSYDIIVPKFQKFAAQRDALGKDYYVRGTFTRNNLDFAEDILHFADLGFRHMSMEPVVAEESAAYGIREEDLPQVMEEYDRLAKEFITRKKEGRGFNFFHFMLDLTAGPCVAKRMSGCGSGTEYLAVTPWGDLYPCHQFVGMDEFLLGNVDEGIKKTDVVNEFKSCNVYAKPECKNCFARFYCSGGCNANAYNFSGDLNGNYRIGCEMQKKRIECAIMIKAALAEAAS